MHSEQEIQRSVDAVYRSESRRFMATLVRLLRDFDLAEEAMHEAFASAVTQWAENGMPENPRAWLVSTGRFKAIDSLRRRLLPVSVFATVESKSRMVLLRRRGKFSVATT